MIYNSQVVDGGQMEQSWGMEGIYLFYMIFIRGLIVEVNLYLINLLRFMQAMKYQGDLRLSL